MKWSAPSEIDRYILPMLTVNGWLLPCSIIWCLVSISVMQASLSTAENHSTINWFLLRFDFVFLFLLIHRQVRDCGIIPDLCNLTHATKGPKNYALITKNDCADLANIIHMSVCQSHISKDHSNLCTTEQRNNKAINQTYAIIILSNSQRRVTAYHEDTLEK